MGWPRAGILIELPFVGREAARDSDNDCRRFMAQNTLYSSHQPQFRQASAMSIPICLPRGRKAPAKFQFLEGEHPNLEPSSAILTCQPGLSSWGVEARLDRKTRTFVPWTRARAMILQVGRKTIPRGTCRDIDGESRALGGLRVTGRRSYCARSLDLTRRHRTRQCFAVVVVLGLSDANRVQPCRKLKSS